MNYATRTQKEIYPVKVGGHILVKAEFANELELQNDQLAKQCVKFVEEISELRERVKRGDAMLRGWREDEGQDSKRMEWILECDCVEFYTGLRITRDAIDQAMKEEQT